MDGIQSLKEAIIKGQKKDVARIAVEAVESGLEATTLVDEAVVPGMNTVSELWQKGEYYVPEVMRSAATMQAAMDALKPYLVGSGGHGKGVKVAVGTVKGDLHDIGKNLVAIMLEGVGYEVENLGVDLPPERFIEAAKNGAQVIGMSSLLTTSMPAMENTVAAFGEAGLRDKVKLIVGGAPVTADFAKSIGADHYANDAAAAVALLNELFE